MVGFTVSKGGESGVVGALQTGSAETGLLTRNHLCWWFKLARKMVLEEKTSSDLFDRL